MALDEAAGETDVGLRLRRAGGGRRSNGERNSNSRSRSRPGNGGSRRLGDEGRASSWDRTMKKTPASTMMSPAPRTTDRGALNPSSSPNSRAPHTNAVIMFKGVHVPLARAKPMFSEARNAV